MTVFIALYRRKPLESHCLVKQLEKGGRTHMLHNTAVGTMTEGSQFTNHTDITSSSSILGVPMPSAKPQAWLGYSSGGFQV